MAKGRKDEQEFIVICGCPRSGTTLISQILETDFGVAIPIETHFIPHFYRWRILWGSLADQKVKQSLVDAIRAYSRIWIYRGMRGKNPDGLARHSLIDALDNRFEDANRFDELIRDIFDRFAALNQLQVSGDKSAPFTPNNLDQYASALGQIRVIHIVRDGRDVALSWTAQWFGPKSIAHAAKLWKQHVKHYAAWGADHPERYLQIGYEELVSDPIIAQQKLSQFLDIQRGRYVDRPSLADALSSETTHTLLSKPLQSANAEKWRSNMSVRDQAMFQSIAADQLQSFGYEIKPIGKPLFLRRVIATLNSKVRPLFSTNAWLRQARSSMPVFFWAIQRFGFKADCIAQRMTKQSKAIDK